jgi:hypothetical protein
MAIFFIKRKVHLQKISKKERRKEYGEYDKDYSRRGTNEE